MKKTGIFLLALLTVFGLAYGQSSKKKASKAKTQTQIKMKYRPLGATGLSVSELGLGCGAFSNFDTAQSRAFMDVAMASGMNYIDIYDSDPKVRSNIGYALKNRREDMIIQGHVGVFWKDGQYSRTRNLAESKAGFEDLLKRLGTDYIDVGMIHICDKVSDWQELEGSEFLAYVTQLKKQGKIRHIGMSSHNPEVALLAAKSGWIDVIMFSLNPAFDRLSTSVPGYNPQDFDYKLDGINPVRVELYDYCTMNRIAITVMKVFGGGGRLLDETKSPLGIGLTPVQCIAYSLSKPCVATALCGASTIEELMSDLAYLDATAEQKDYNAALDKKPKANTKGGACTYCHHCAPCAVGIDIAKVNSLLDEAERHETVPESVKAEYKALPHKAGECIHCGACETRCPFGVSVQSRMDKAKEVFGE